MTLLVASSPVGSRYSGGLWSSCAASRWHLHEWFPVRQVPYALRHALQQLVLICRYFRGLLCRVLWRLGGLLRLAPERSKE